jgi:predicted nucleic acid-binding protein
MIAPDLVYAEIGNAIWKRAVGGEISRAAAVEALETVTGLFTSLVPMHELAARAMEIALTLKHPIYDCFYLALGRARARGADQRGQKAAGARQAGEGD